MTQEDKELLFKDLSARLPYGVKGIITYDKSNTTFTVEGIDNNVLHLSYAEDCYVEDFKPYLRPLSSMTDEEREEYRKFSYYGAAGVRPYTHGDFVAVPSFEKMDWLNAHHFDYRGLIEKDLALKAPEGMYK